MTINSSSTTTTSSVTSVIIFITSTIVGVNAPSPAAFANALGALLIPLFMVGLSMMVVYGFRMRGDFGITILLSAFFVGNLIGMLRNGNLTTAGVIPIAITAEAAVFLITWVLAGGATRNA